MTLPFEHNNNNARTYQCFVCGVHYNCFEDFSAHIKEKHEEGREYITCPKCSAPVRDLKSHYKIKHAGWEIPTNVQTRVAVWTDFSGKGKKRKVSFNKGSFISQKMNGKEFYYRSGLEKKVYLVLEKLNDVVEYWYEPYEIPYFHQGKWKKYRPDMIVKFADGHREIWEIKPKNQTNLEINESKWNYAGKWCQERNMSFIVITEHGLAKLQHKTRGY